MPSTLPSTLRALSHLTTPQKFCDKGIVLTLSYLLENYELKRSVKWVAQGHRARKFEDCIFIQDVLAIFSLPVYPASYTSGDWNGEMGKDTKEDAKILRK